MKSLYLEGDRIEIRDLPKPGDPQMAVVRVLMAGICNTDLELIKGYMNFSGVLGHEFVGEVVSAPDRSWIGKRACGEINFGCGDCTACRRGLSRHCPNRTVLGILNQNGAFAEFVAIPETNLVPVPNSLRDRAAVFAEPLAAAMEILEQVKIEPTSRIAVIGDGKLGLIIAQVLKLTGADLTVVGKHQRKLDLARRWGMITALPDRLEKQTFDIAVEASGSSSGFNTALEVLRPRGTMILKSTYHGELSLNAAPIVINEVQIVGSRCGRFEPAIRLLEAGCIDTDSLVDQTFPFADALAALDAAQKRGTLKVLLDFDGKNSRRTR